jgi:hypothetical protein
MTIPPEDFDDEMLTSRFDPMLLLETLTVYEKEIDDFMKTKIRNYLSETV